MRALVLILSSLLLVSACRREPTPPASEPATAPPATAPPAIAPLAAHGATATVPAGSTAGATVRTPTLEFALPAGWTQQTAASAMRAAQVAVPGEAGAAELVLFYFGPGQGGGVESNFERWRGQMEADPRIAPERGELAVNGLRISWIDVRGTLLPSTMGSGPSTPQPGSRLIGAVIEGEGEGEGEGGPWFLKLTGPEATLVAQREAFFELLRSVRRP